MSFVLTPMPWPTDEHGAKIHWSELFKVHPAAAVFPMLSGPEMDALVEDIKTHGLQMRPMVWESPDETTYLIDGRNRLEAAMRADVELGWRPGPNGNGWWLGESSSLDTEADPVAYIIGANVHRRHLTKGQQAELIIAATKAGATLEESARVFSPIEGKKGGSTKNKIREIAFANCEAIGLSEATAKSAWDNAAKNDRLENNRSFQEPLTTQTASATITKKKTSVKNNQVKQKQSTKVKWPPLADPSSPKRDRIAAVWEYMAYLKIKHADLTP